MKLNTLFSLVLITAITAFGQIDATPQITQWGDHAIGGYVSAGASYSTVDTDPAGYLDLRAALTIDGRWAIGLAGSALNYDKELTALVSDGTYRLQSGYVGLFIERLFTLSSAWTLSASFMSGQGTAFYQYDKEYRKEKVWSEEVIDRTSYGVQVLSLDLHRRLTDRLWLGITGSVRNTSPLRLLETPDDLFKTLNGGISLKYGIF
jgi:hypothetical protein